MGCGPVVAGIRSAVMASMRGCCFFFVFLVTLCWAVEKSGRRGGMVHVRGGGVGGATIKGS